MIQKILYLYSRSGKIKRQRGNDPEKSLNLKRRRLPDRRTSLSKLNSSWKYTLIAKVKSREMKQIFDSDTLAILGLSILAFIDRVDPMVKLGILIVGIMTLIFRIIKDRKEEKRAKRAEELEKEKRAEEREEHELRMKLLQKELEEKEHKL